MADHKAQSEMITQEALAARLAQALVKYAVLTVLAESPLVLERANLAYRVVWDAEAVAEQMIRAIANDPQAGTGSANDPLTSDTRLDTLVATIWNRYAYVPAATA